MPNMFFFRTVIEDVHRDYPVYICDTLRQSTGATTNYITFLDAVEYVMRLKNVSFNRTEILHYNRVAIHTTIDVLLIIQRHTKRRRTDIPKALNLRHQQLEIYASASDDEKCPPWLKAVLLGATYKNNVFCIICQVMVDRFHFLDSHVHMAKPEIPQHVGVEEFYVTAKGTIYMDPVTALGRIVSNNRPLYCTCVQKKERWFETGEDFNAHLVLHHLPRVPARSLKPKHKENENQVILLPQAVSVEEFIFQIGDSQDKEKIKKLDIESTIFETLMFLLKKLKKQVPNQASVSLWEHAKHLSLPVFMQQVDARAAAISRSQPEQILDCIFTCINACRQGNSRILSLIEDSDYTRSVGISTYNDIVCIAAKSMFPIRTEELGVVEISSPVTALPCGRTSINGNKIQKISSTNELLQAFNMCKDQKMIVEIEAIPTGQKKPDAEYIRRQIVLIKKMHSLYTQAFSPIVILAVPERKLWIDEEHITKLYSEGENLTAAIAMFEQVIFLPLGGLWMPSREDLITDARPDGSPVLSTKKEPLSTKGAELLSNTILTYMAEITIML